MPLPDGRSVPLGVVADIEYAQGYPLIWRRDRVPTMGGYGTKKTGQIIWEYAGK